VHEIECEYGDYSNGRGCSVKIKEGEPFLLLNLETLYDVARSRGVSGPHPDFVYIARDKNNEAFHVYLVELKDISDVDTEQLKNIFENIRDKFAQSVGPIKQHVVQHLIVSGFASYYAVIALPLHEGQVKGIGSLLKHLKTMFNLLRRTGFNECWIVPCGSKVHDKAFSLF